MNQFPIIKHLRKIYQKVHFHCLSFELKPRTEKLAYKEILQINVKKLAHAIIQFARKVISFSICYDSSFDMKSESEPSLLWETLSLNQ